MRRTTDAKEWRPVRARASRSQPLLPPRLSVRLRSNANANLKYKEFLHV